MVEPLHYSEVQKFNNRLKDEVEDAKKALNEKVVAPKSRNKERYDDILTRITNSPFYY
jgi:hypothetical protein